ncbi:transmembrane 9 superfamily member [Citrus sinensis]|nr:transmembrane 9 superfamily member [Citrus sinensis]
MAIMNRRTSLIVLILIAALLPLLISTKNLKPELTSQVLEPHQLKEGDLIPFFASKVFQRADGCGAKSYFDLPFCPAGDPILNRMKSTEEIVKGDCITKTKYELRFKVETVGKILCEKNLKTHEVRKFRDAISNEVDYHMYYNNILLRGVVGIVKEKSLTVDSRTRYYLVKHINFYPYYYENKVVGIYALPDIKSAVDITEDAEISVNFTYSVNWKVKSNPTNSVHQNETAIMRDSEDKESMIFWGAMFCIWLMLLIVAIDPYLQNYFDRYPPRVITLTENGIRYKDIFVLILYCISSCFPGYLATQFNGTYTTFGRRECIMQTAVLYTVPVFLTLAVVNSAAWFADIPESATPLGPFVAWGLGNCFFTILGGTRGHPNYEPGKYCATRTTQMVIPWWQSWLISTPAQMLLGGLLPFLFLLGDMDEIYASFLFLKVCGAHFTVFRFFVCNIIMTTVIATVSTSYQLSCEDFNIWWRSVFRGGSTAIFIFAYGIYFQYRIKKGNLGPLFIFMCYNACFCYALFLILGAVSFYASLYVYGTKKLNLHKRD